MVITAPVLYLYLDILGPVAADDSYAPGITDRDGCTEGDGKSRRGSMSGFYKILGRAG